jgi:glucokinase
MTVISIDVGGTGMKCALVDGAYRVLHTERHPTGRERGPDAVIETILAVASGLSGKADVRAVGVVVPGIIDEVNGIARYSANVGFKDVPLRALLQERLGLPAVLGHDVRAGGLAEARLGAGRGKAQVLVVPIGTGIAAAHVVNGVVNSGAHGAYGEIGHIVVRPGGPKCGCGLYGCLEALASASALQRSYFEVTGEVASAAEIAAKVRTDKRAKRVWDDLVDALSDGLLTGQALYDPELVVIGGGLAESGELLLNPLRRAFKKKATFHRVPKIVRAKLGDEAGCLGAALLALDLKEVSA